MTNSDMCIICGKEIGAEPQVQAFRLHETPEVAHERCATPAMHVGEWIRSSGASRERLRTMAPGLSYVVTRHHPRGAWSDALLGPFKTHEEVALALIVWLEEALAKPHREHDAAALLRMFHLDVVREM